MRAQGLLVVGIAAVLAVTGGACIDDLECQVTSDCGGGRVCVAFACTNPCNDAADCTSAQLCIAGACRALDDLDDLDGGAEHEDGGAREDAGGPRDAGTSSRDGGVVVDVDSGVGCGPGLHDGGDGSCVADGTCASGYVLGYADDDDDGVGAGAAIGCVSSSAPPAGVATSSDDCDPLDDTRWVDGPAWRDADLDGWTTIEEVVCRGAVAPVGWRDAQRGPPYASFQVGNAFSLSSGAFNDDEWDNPQQAQLRSVLSATVTGLDSDDTSELLVLYENGLALPDDAVITGLELHVFRNASAGGVVLDATVRLRDDGAMIGTEHASLTPWSVTQEEAVYGSPTDLWGLPALLAGDVSAQNFGVALAAKSDGAANQLVDASVDFASIYVFTDDGVDCDDDEPALFLSFAAYTDADGDRFGGASAGTQCLAAASLPDGFSDRGGDCADNDDRARPDATTYYNLPRPDGSFDINCDGNETWLAITDATACTLDVTTCTTTFVQITEAPCGESQSVEICNPACELETTSKTTLCR